MEKQIIRVAAFSDSHNFHNSITLPEADIVICAGDYTQVGSLPEFNAFMHWFSNQEQCANKCLINGNHEVGFEKDFDSYRSLIPSNINFLHDSEITIEGLKIYGSAWTKEFFNWAWMYNSEEQAREIWDKIPLDTDILIHHQPMYAYHDYVERLLPHETDHNVGCKILAKRVDKLDNLLLSITGHLHSKKNYGASKVGNTMFCNVAQLNDHYINKNRKPLLFEIDKNTGEIDLINY